MTGIKTSIGWCTHTNNCTTGCLGPSGRPCSYCWAVTFRKRLAGSKGTIQHALGQASLDLNTPAISMFKLAMLDSELGRARKPRRIFFASMGDLGYEGRYKTVEPRGKKLVVTGEASASWVRLHVFDLMTRHPRHTFLILSKQPEGLLHTDWPENAHVGVSVSSSYATEEKRIRTLRKVHCGLRWVSVEPLLQLDFDPSVLHGARWVVVGVETGPKANDPILYCDAAARIVRWCDNYDVPVFVKDNIIHMPGEWPQDVPA